jgi:cytochrome c oxidase cbb3-type subunit 1
VFGTFVVWAIGGLVYTWPRLYGRSELWSWTLGNWSFWLITVGISVMGLVLTAGGLMQGYQWMSGTEWIDSILPVRPFWFARTLAGITMDIGMTLLVVNLIMTSLQTRAASRSVPDRRPGPILAEGAAE